MLTATLHDTIDCTQQVEIDASEYPTFLVYDGDVYVLQGHGSYTPATVSFHIIKPRSVRAKFIVQFNRLNSSTQVADVILTPVLATTEENLAFWEATPAGQINLQITNPKASAEFEVGTDFYVDFIRATPREPDTAIWKQ